MSDKLTNESKLVHTTSVNGVSYVLNGRVCTVNLNQVILTEGLSIGVPSANSNLIITVRDEDLGGITQVCMAGGYIVASGAGSSNFNSGRRYSGNYTYITPG